MKKTSIIKIVCVIAVLLSIITYQTFFSYKKLDPHIVLVKESTSFLHQTLTIGQPLVVEGQRGSQYYGYLYVNGKKKEGYISSKKVQPYTFDESFEKELTSFPDSYKQPLRFLHALYPEWRYVPLNTSLDFNDTASIFQSKSLIDTNDSSMIASPDIIEGQTWCRVSLNAARYFLDPRNGLDAYHALMFEKLTYNPSETLQEGKRMLAGTEMSGIEPQSEKDWAELYRYSAEVNNISMSLLITRAIQEQTGGGLGLRGGHARNNPQGPLFYNIYNIGANSSDQDGIDFAASRNWDTREKAILYGSKYLSDNYITKGQDSLYLQKFDVHNNNPGHHYYMSNIRAPYSEAKNMLRGYKSNHMDHVKRILEIPLYTHMPVYNAYPISTDIKYAGTIMKNPHCEYQIVNTYKNLTENVDYISINHKTYTHIVGLNNYYGSCDIPK